MVRLFHPPPESWPPLWADPTPLVRAARTSHMVLEENLLRHLLPVAGVPDHRGLMLVTEEWGHRHADRLAEWAGETLAVRGNGYWPRVRRLLTHISRQFFAADRDAPGWVQTETFRDALPHQNPGLVQTTHGSVRTLRRPVTARRNGRRLLNIHLPPGTAVFAGREERPRRGDRLVGYETVRRTVAADGRPAAGLYQVRCLASPGDDADYLTRCLIPAGTRLQLVPGVNGGRLVTWFRVLGRGGWLDCHSVDLVPDCGRLVSVRSARLPFRLLTAMHPRIERWLTTASGYPHDALPSAS